MLLLTFFLESLYGVNVYANRDKVADREIDTVKSLKS